MTAAFVIPAAYRTPDTDFTAAGQMLGMSHDELVDTGLPVTDGRFDSRDLFNLGLHSGTGRTVPEQAFAFALRWMRSGTDALLATRRYSFELSVSCDCGAPSTLARPAPYDGTVDYRAESDTGFAATVETVGVRAPVRSPEVREIMREFFSREPRWVKLPDALREDESLLVSHGVASCESASRYLARQCVAAGVEATTRIGWVAGMLDLVHAWVEVVDTDGETKVLDPIFGMFAALIPGANPALTDPAVSLRTNRLIPTTMSVGGRVLTHPCAAARLSTKILPAKEAR